MLITPHVAGYTPRLWDRCADVLVENLATVDEDGSYTDLRNDVKLA